MFTNIEKELKKRNLLTANDIVQYLEGKTLKIAVKNESGHQYGPGGTIFEFAAGATLTVSQGRFDYSGFNHVRNGMNGGTIYMKEMEIQVEQNTQYLDEIIQIEEAIVAAAKERIADYKTRKDVMQKLGTPTLSDEHYRAFQIIKAANPKVRTIDLARIEEVANILSA